MFPAVGAVTSADPGCRVKPAAAGSKPHRTHGISPLMPIPRAEGHQTMLGIIAAVLFVIAFILNAAGTSAGRVFAPFSLMLIGLACLALHLAGIGTGWRLRR
jgi:hypothetical protein